MWVFLIIFFIRSTIAEYPDASSKRACVAWWVGVWVASHKSVTMAQTSLLQGKRFYCREWVFHKIQHCLQEKTGTSCGSGREGPPVAGGGTLSSAGKSGSWGVLLVGGPGSGKTALCTELLWPSSQHGGQRGLSQFCLAFHFCRADDSDTVCVSGFIRGLVTQICRSGLVPQYEEKIRDPAIQNALKPGECERNPSEVFKRWVT